jgi:hypothetical protein
MSTLSRATLRFLVIITMYILLTVGTAAAQAGLSQVSGIVKDISGAVVPGASVTITNERTGITRSTAANENGYYVVPGLPASTYTIRIGAQGLKTAEMKAVALLAGDSVTLNSNLSVGEVAETILVSATQEATVDTSSARIGANVNEREVNSLPLNGRQLSQLYLQAPGSVNTGSGGFFDIRFSGRSNEQNAIRFDGIEGSAVIDSNPGNLNGELTSPFRLQTSLENVQEFRVDSSNYPAEYGTGTGGQVSVVTKSGSNRFHGAAFEYLRNDKFDARNFFDRVGKSPLRLNQFGASLGGPIVKERVFFYGFYEGYRLRSGLNNIEAVPSDATRARAVPAVAPLIDAFRGPGGFIIPNASTNPDFAIYQLPTNLQVDENAAGLRLDFKLSDKYTLYTRFFRDQGVTNMPDGGSVAGRRVNYRAVPQNGVIALQGSLTQRLVNELKFGYNGALTRVVGSAPIVNGIDMSSIAINISGSVANSGIPGQGSSSGIAVAGGQIRGSSSFNGRGFPYTPYSLSFIDNLSWVKGNHSAKFGLEIRPIRMYYNMLGGTTYTYSNLTDFLANRVSAIAYGSDLSDPSPFNNGATGNREFKTAFYIGYAQDEWKVRSNLTLSYGLRYEYYQTMHEARNLAVRFDINTGTLLPADQPWYNSSKTNFGPRVGLAWSPNPSGKGWFGAGKTVARAGFGIFYGPGQLEDQIQPVQSDRINLSLSSGSYPVDVGTLRSNFVSNPNNRGYQPRAFDPNYKIPEQIYQYSLSIQQELPGKMNLTLAYVGDKGRNLFLRAWGNKIVSVIQPDQTKAATAVRQFSIVQGTTVQNPFAEIDYKTSGGEDSYDSMQVTFGRRFTSGLTLNSQYTWGRSYGNTSGSNDAVTTNNPYDFNNDYGYNRFDVRQSFNVSAVYALPFGRSMSGAKRSLVGGWEIGTIVNARTGIPVDLFITRPDIAYVDAAGLVYGSPAAGRTAVINTPGGGSSRNARRPDVVAGVNPYLNNDRALINPAAFSIPKPGTVGNLMRGAVRGPDYRQFDFIVNKKFRISESSSVDFRAEFFNVFNLTNFASPPVMLPNQLGIGTNLLQPGQPFTSAAAGSFGVMTSTVEKTVGMGTQRQIQFALRYSF